MVSVCSLDALADTDGTRAKAVDASRVVFSARASAVGSITLVEVGRACGDDGGHGEGEDC